MVVIGLDVGGSSIKHGVVDLANPFATTPQTTPINSRGSQDEIIHTFASIIHTHWQKNPIISKVGFGFPGPFSYDTGVSNITGLEKYESIYGLNIKNLLVKKLSLSNIDIRFRNDAEAAIVGESLYGIGKSFKRLIGITLGTGFGSAFIANGNVVTDGDKVPLNGWLYPITFKGKRADDVFSTRGLSERFKEANIYHESLATLEPSETGVKKVYAEFGSDLGTFLKPFVEAFQADCVIILGGIAGAYHLFANQVSDELGSDTILHKGILNERAPLLGIANLFQI